MAPLLNRNFPFVLKVDVVDGSESNVNKFFKKVHFATSCTTSTTKKAYLSQKHKAEDCHYRKVFYFIFFCRQQAFSASCLQVQNSDDENQPENTEGTFSKYRIAYYFPLIGLFFSQVSKAFTGRNSAKAYEDLSPLVLNFSAAQFFPKTTCDSHLKRKGNSIYT